MRLPKSISDNLRFLTAELSAQVANLSLWFADPAPSLAQRIMDRSDYANSLKSRILDNCQLQFANANNTDTDLITLRAVESIATELAQINELCLECLRQKQSSDAEAPRNFARPLPKHRGEYCRLEFCSAIVNLLLFPKLSEFRPMIESGRNPSGTANS